MCFPSCSLCEPAGRAKAIIRADAAGQRRQSDEDEAVKFRLGPQNWDGYESSLD